VSLGGRIVLLNSVINENPIFYFIPKNAGLSLEESA
jgi:hypothetical protein